MPSLFPLSSRCALILKKRDFYLCICNFLDAVVAVEKVAEHINEMQRITEQFSPVFHQLVVECGGFEVILSIDILKSIFGTEA